MKNINCKTTVYNTGDVFNYKIKKVKDPAILFDSLTQSVITRKALTDNISGDKNKFNYMLTRTNNHLNIIYIEDNIESYRIEYSID